MVADRSRVLQSLFKDTEACWGMWPRRAGQAVGVGKRATGKATLLSRRGGGSQHRAHRRGRDGGTAARRRQRAVRGRTDAGGGGGGRGRGCQGGFLACVSTFSEV